MLELTGACCSSMEAVEFFEFLADVIPEEVKTDEFCDQYERALNRFRYEASKDIGRKKHITVPKTKGLHKQATCGKCGFGANNVEYAYCPNCGTRYINE